MLSADSLAEKEKRKFPNPLLKLTPLSLSLALRGAAPPPYLFRAGARDTLSSRRRASHIGPRGNHSSDNALTRSQSGNFARLTASGIENLLRKPSKERKQLCLSQDIT